MGQHTATTHLWRLRLRTSVVVFVSRVERLAMHVLLIGSGVVGSVYGSQLVAAGHRLSVLVRPKDADSGRRVLTVCDIEDGTHQRVEFEPVSSVGFQEYDLVLVAVRADQLGSSFATLSQLSGEPHVVFFGNNPDGHAALRVPFPGTLELGFPGIGGVVRVERDVVEYMKISQQPTILEAGQQSAGSIALEEALQHQGFAVIRTDHIDGWLKYHAVFVSAISAALLRCNVDAALLASDRGTLTLMCRCIEEGFGALKDAGTPGLPKNLAVLHRPILRPFAVRYWSRTLRTPTGELCFAGHTRHARSEMIALGTWVLNATTDSSVPHEHLTRLLALSAT